MLKVFIGGHPRSGTTLLGAMIGSHSHCICTPESHFKTRAFRYLNPIHNGKIDPYVALDLIKKQWRFKLWDIKLTASSADGIASYQDLLIWIVKSYAKKVGKLNPGIWIDHTPANLEYADILTTLFPEAKFLHIIRDGRAVASSVIPLDWGANTIHEAAHSWGKKVSQGLSVESLLGRERIMRVRYEDLIQAPEPTMNKICRFLQIDFQPQMLKGVGFLVPQFQAEEHALVGKPLEINRVNAWEKALTARQIEIFESIASELLLSLGYSLIFGPDAKKMTVSESLISGFQETYRRNIINKFRRKKRIRDGIASAQRS